MKRTPRPYPREVTADTIAEARAWLHEAADMDGVPPTEENLLSIAQEHAPIVGAMPGGRVMRDSLLIAAGAATI